jgi:predicted Ser/Thr protein kinase
VIPSAWPRSESPASGRCPGSLADTIPGAAAVQPAIPSAIPARLGEFVVVGVLGEGGSGVVYDARWGHREIALKVLHPALVATAREREQFLAEGRRLAEIHHAGVVKVLGVGELPDGRPFLAMEKLRGETLAARLGRGPLPLGESLERFAQLCDAVEAFHQRGLIHRDLKPENVMVVAGADGGQHAVLLDFGIAKELASPASTTTQDGGVRGTPAYMAPERFFGQAATVATDVYELAVTLFAMLAGRLPWSDCADPEVRLDPRRLAEVAPHVPAALDVEVRRALSTRAQNRPARAAELGAAVLAAAGMEWAPRTTLDVRSGPVGLADPAGPPAPPPMPGQTAGAAARTTSTRRARTGPLVAAFVGVAALATGVGIAAHHLGAPGDRLDERAGETPEAPVGDPDPPAGDRDPPAAVAAVDLDRHREEIRAALSRLPDDVIFVLGLQVAQMEGDALLRPLLDLFVDSQPGKVIRAQAGLVGCDLDVRGLADWVVFAGPAEDLAVDLVAAGRWHRDEVEACLRAALGAGEVRRDGRLTVFALEDGVRTAGWLDERTLLLSSRPGADAAWMTTRLDDLTAPAGALAPALAEIDLGAAIWIAGDDSGLDRAELGADSELAGLWGALLVSPSRVRLDVRLRYPDAAKAAAAETEMQAQLGGLGLDATLGHIKIARDPARADVLHLDVAFARMIAELLVGQLQASGLEAFGR